MVVMVHTCTHRILQDSNNMSATDVVEPPKYITGRNVASVFERLGYNPEAGVKLFVALCEALARRREHLHRSVSGAQGDFGSVDVPPPSPLSTPPKPGTTLMLQLSYYYYHTTTIILLLLIVFFRANYLCYYALNLSVNLTLCPHTHIARNAALSALVGGIAETVSALTLSSGRNSPTAATTPTPPSATSTTGSVRGAGGDASASGGVKTKDYKMDAQDFCE